MIITTLITLYFGINTFAAGVYFGEEWRFTRDKTEQFQCLVWTFLSIVWFIPYIVFAVVFALASRFLEWSYISFWWYFFLTKKYDSVDKDLLNEINECAKKKTCKTYKDWMYRVSTKALNKRNKFTPPASS